MKYKHTNVKKILFTNKKATTIFRENYNLRILSAVLNVDASPKNKNKTGLNNIIGGMSTYRVIYVDI